MADIAPNCREISAPADIQLLYLWIAAHLQRLMRSMEMERKDEHDSDELIDLGSVSQETKGNSGGLGDTVIQRQLMGIGLEDD
ncbi:benenodin family lasso peptide [Sphingomonas sp.]|uniref:benenodin family lasso peptide n=1 Tax=Sphingomonas sp. TaxID=28214 RepID=UPI0025F08167|nr:benenodin family lasso peptide [Sphingomonas sp.]